MARTIHWIGVSLIFISALLLLITTISAPVIKDIAILKVTRAGSSVNFGTFGYCRTDQNFCSRKTIGYKPADIVSFTTTGARTADTLTNLFILHPIACGLAFIAGLAAIGGAVGGLIGTLIAGVAWILTLVVMAIDFAAFGIIKNHVNGDGSGSHAFYHIGMWTTLAATVLLFFGMVIVFFTCCRDRRARRRSYDGPAKPVRRRRFFRRNRY